jgi:hypothetical protein
MLHFLRLKNFHSVKDELHLDLMVGAHVPTEDGRFGPIHQGNCGLAPKVIGIYGPNASGKSTLLKGISFVSWFMHGSFSIPPESELFCQPFNTEESYLQPLEIEIGFCAPSDLSNPQSTYCRYAYCLRLDTAEGKVRKVISEALYYWPPRTIKRRRIFLRENDKLASSPRLFHATGFVTPLGNILRPNVSMIATLVQLGHKPSIWLRDNFARSISSNILVQKFEQSDSQVAQLYAQNDSYSNALNREIQRLDLGIEKVTFDRSAVTNQYAANFKHAGLSKPLGSVHESNGTRQFVRIFPMIAAALETGGVALIDELDNSIHPLILPEIIGWFYDPVRNPKGAQLWFTCQNVYLLNVLAKEQIIFCEKDLIGRTTAFGLRDIKSVRRADNYAKKYLGGAYGAVPHIG